MYRYYHDRNQAHNNGVRDYFQMKIEGIGKANAEPDQAIVSVGIKTEDPEILVAQQENAQKSTDVINALIAIGISEEDIETTDYYINIRYDYQDGQQIFRGYVVGHILQITVRDISQVGTVIDTAVSSGANLIQNIKFTVEDPDYFYNQALANAITNANEKATVIANSISVTVQQPPIKIIENKELQEVPFPRVLSLEAQAPGIQTPIEPRTLEFQAKISIIYQYHR
ncbi:SIMPL domain-containing protein [Anaerobacillus sp. MEB173]|uniref:SIMPL domain-containing protein n=1 Tax=Anaerobacillus sp. MEB173 TaxID=3383345 RepID=UPI003F9151DE